MWTIVKLCGSDDIEVHQALLSIPQVAPKKNDGTICFFVNFGNDREPIHNMIDERLTSLLVPSHSVRYENHT